MCANAIPQHDSTIPASRGQLTWERLVELEPRLGPLLAEIRAIKDNGRRMGFCANVRWYGYHEYWGQGFKKQMARLVGWHRVPAGSDRPQSKPMRGDASRAFEVVSLWDLPEPEPLDMEAEGPERAVLYGSEAYDLAYNILYSALPHCRDCACWP